MIYKTKHTKLSEKYPTLLSFLKYSFEIFRFQCYLLRRNLCLLLPPSLPLPPLYSMGSSYYVEAGLKISVSRSKIQAPHPEKRPWNWAQSCRKPEARFCGFQKKATTPTPDTPWIQRDKGPTAAWGKQLTSLVNPSWKKKVYLEAFSWIHIIKTYDLTTPWPELEMRPPWY